jgi:hypothetical protein
MSVRIELHLSQDRVRVLLSGVMHKNTHKWTLVGILLLAISTVAAAQERKPIDVSVLGPQVGESVPDFSLSDQHGQLQTLESVRGPNGSLILFHRSADW